MLPAVKRGVVASLLLGGALTVLAPQTTARPTSTATKTGSPIRDCVSEKGRLAALFLIDQSGSLQETDPADRRVEAMKAAVAALSLNAELKTTTERDYQLEVRFDGFGVGHTSTGEWHRLTLTANAAVESEIDAFADRDNELQTDYKTGLEKAVQALSEYEQVRGEDACKLLVWLSDGELYLGDEDSDEAEIEAASNMCAADSGIADQMRSLDIYTVGFGLTTTSGQQPNFALMEGLVTGASGCGARAGFGRFVKVEGADALIQALFRDLSPIPPDSKPVGACREEPSNLECGEFRFTTRPPLDRVKMIVSTTVGINTAEVIDPGGQRTGFVANGSAVQATTPSVSSNPLYQFTSIVSIEVQKSSTPYGEWVVQFRGPAAREALVSALFFSDVVAEILGPDPITIERDNPVPFQVRISELGVVGLQLPSGSTSVAEFDEAPSLEATLTIGYEIVPTQTTMTNKDEGLFEIRVNAADLSNVGPLGSLKVRPVARLNGVDIAFGDSFRDVKILLGDGLPSIQSVSASDIDDKGASRVQITIAGPQEGTGSVEISKDFEILDAPQPTSLTDFALKLDTDKVVVGAGESAVLDAELDPSFTANGKLAFRLNLVFEGRGNKQVSVPLDFEVKMSRPFNTGRAIGWLIAMILVFIITQAAAVAMAATVLARVRSMPVWTRTASFPVTISSDGSVTSEGGAIADRLRRYRTLPEALTASHFHRIEGLTYSVSRAAAIRSLFNPRPVTVTAAADGSPLADLQGDSGRLEKSGYVKAVVRPELFESWVLQVLERRETEVDGHLTVILPRDSEDAGAYAFDLEAALRISGLAAESPKEVATTDGRVPEVDGSGSSDHASRKPTEPKPPTVGDEIDPFS